MYPRLNTAEWNVQPPVFGDIYKIYVVNIIYYLMAATFLKFAYQQGLMEKNLRLRALFSSVHYMWRVTQAPSIRRSRDLFILSFIM